MASASAFTFPPSFPSSTCRKPKRKAISPAIFCRRSSQFGLRREILKGLSLFPLSLPLFESIIPLPSESKEVEVGSYLPPSQSDPSFVFFKASPSDTPALRAGIMTYFCIVLPIIELGMGAMRVFQNSVLVCGAKCSTILRRRKPKLRKGIL